MDQNKANMVKEIMIEFSRLTGLEPQSDNPKRYLWTDAFAVCNYLELFRQTKDKKYLDLAIRLVNQVHHVLGKHREDDSRTGWISGLEGKEAEIHPTIAGLRIGKKLNERKPHEPIDQRLEWDQDGQYYHYLTKWMHALNRVSQVTKNVKYLRWAMELAKAAHKGFTHLPANRERKIMYWKMSIDLSYPLVPSMGQHDPLDGFVTYNELQVAAKKNFDHLDMPELTNEISEMVDICRGMNWTTTDPLGIGGLLFDVSRTAQLMVNGNLNYNNLFEVISNSAILGMGSFANSNTLMVPADYRLAFRELGLLIGLNSVKILHEWLKENQEYSEATNFLKKNIQSILIYLPVGDEIERFWVNRENWKYRSWIEHQEINMVMLATSLAPNEFIMI